MPGLHLRCTVLPEGEVRDMWILGGRITFTRPRTACDTVLTGGYVLPGLVDAHAHPGHDPATMAFDPAGFAAAARSYAAAGTPCATIRARRPRSCGTRRWCCCAAIGHRHSGPAQDCPATVDAWRISGRLSGCGHCCRI